MRGGTFLDLRSEYHCGVGSNAESSEYQAAREDSAIGIGEDAGYNILWEFWPALRKRVPGKSNEATRGLDRRDQQADSLRKKQGGGTSEAVAEVLLTCRIPP